MDGKCCGRTGTCLGRDLCRSLWLDSIETTPSYDSGAELAYGEEDLQPETQEESEMQSECAGNHAGETAGGDKETQGMQKNGDTADGEQETEVFISEEASTVLTIAAVVLAGCVLLLFLFAE